MKLFIYKLKEAIIFALICLMTLGFLHVFWTITAWLCGVDRGY